LKLKSNILWFILIVSLSATLPAKAQLAQQGRYEKEVKVSEAGFTVIPMKSEGIALVREIKTPLLGSKFGKWELEILDTALTVVWSTQI
jgi:hypothetical protein